MLPLWFALLIKCLLATRVCWTPGAHGVFSELSQHCHFCFTVESVGMCQTTFGLKPSCSQFWRGNWHANTALTRIKFCKCLYSPHFQDSVIASVKRSFQLLQQIQKEWSRLLVEECCVLVELSHLHNLCQVRLKALLVALVTPHAPFRHLISVFLLFWQLPGNRQLDLPVDLISV